MRRSSEYRADIFLGFLDIFLGFLDIFRHYCSSGLVYIVYKSIARLKNSISSIYSLIVIYIFSEEYVLKFSPWGRTNTKPKTIELISTLNLNKIT